MKKKYEKPIFVFESFSLNTSIAGDCGIKTETPSYNNCGIDFGGDFVFIDTTTGCSEDYLVDDGAYNEYCYHVPVDAKRLFNS